GGEYLGQAVEVILRLPDPVCDESTGRFQVQFDVREGTVDLQ
ncbi:unnamed protein product, partial [marine sediment metagenome]